MSLRCLRSSSEPKKLESNMRVRSWPSRPFILRNLSVVSGCLLAVALLMPSMQQAAPVDSEAQRSPQATAKTANHKPSKAEQARAVQAYGKLPLSFEANQGQTDHRVRFLSHGSGYSLFLTPEEAVLTLQTGWTQKPGPKAEGLQPFVGGKKLAPPAILRMQLAGNNAKAGMVGLDELPGKSNYLIGNNPAKWRTGVPNYRKVAEDGVYTGINLVYYGTQRQLEYDFVVEPGADPRAIRLAFQGADHLRTDSQGNLIVSVKGGEVLFLRPIAYQTALDGAKQPVAAQYSIKGRRNVEFKVGKHDPSRSLIIDPTLAYSTYLGGSSIDGANAIAVAPDGTAFIAGGTFSGDFPTSHPLQPNAGGPADFPQDAFVAKISADGSQLLYSTYLGGSATDVAYGIAVDSLGQAYVAGTTDSPNFPVSTNGINSLCGGDGRCGATWNPQGFVVYNGFISKLNVAGSGLVYSSFVGYYENVSCLGVTVDNAQNAYITGEVGPNIQETVPLIPPETPPPLFPIVGGFETTHSNSGLPFGGTDTNAFVMKLDSAGSDILYSSYLGGSNEDVGYAIAVDTLANAYITGITYSTDFPPTTNALGPSYVGAGDAFLTQVNTDATGAASLVYSSYLGGSGLDQGNAVAVDSSTNVYVAGLSTSKASTLDVSVPGSAFQTDCNPGSTTCLGNAFVAKFTLGATPALDYFTYLGGGVATSAAGVAVDSADDAYVAGSTSGDLPTTPNVFQTTYGGGNADAFVTELNPAASALVYSTYLGGSNTDTASGIALNLANPSSCLVLSGNTICPAYVAGQTCSFDFPLANPLQPTYGGNCDAFISEVTVLQGIAVNPSGLLFPTQSIGSTSQAQTVTLTNGETPQTINGISILGADSADFAETTTCPITPSSFGAGATCTISVTFTPTAVGIRKAEIQITDSAPGSPQVVTLTGSTSTVGISAASLAFGSQQVGVASTSKAVTVTNNGTTALTISVVNTSGAFAQNNDCTTAPLQPTTNCVINVIFTPTAPGSSVGALTIADNAPGSPQVVLLTGTGVAAPAVVLSTVTLTFPSQVIGTTSIAQSVNVSNTGGSPLVITNVATTGDFGETNSCGSSLAAGGKCTISVTFTPTANGNRYGTVTITDNAPNSPQTITVSGTGGPAPTVTLSPSALTFAAQTVTTTSAPQQVTLTNTGAAVLDITSIVPSANFAETNNCGVSLAVGASCIINVTFSPLAAGPINGVIAVTDNAINSPQDVTLSGTGQLGPVVVLSPPTLTFTGTPVGSTSLPQSVTLSNTGSAALNITGVSVTGDFAQTNNCGVTVPAGLFCTINVTFTPTTSGNRYGTVSISDNAVNSPQTILMAGNSTAAPAVAFLPSSLTFVSQIIDTTSAPQNAVLTNTGGAALTITSIVASGDFAQTNNCSATLASGASCTISVTFTPTAPGPRAGAVTVTDSAAGSPQMLPLSGNGGQAPIVSLTPTNLTFVGQVLGGTSAAQTVTLANTGSAALSITSITSSGDFAQLNTCGSSVAPGFSCKISVSFTPTALGNRYGAVTITDNASNSPQTVILSGTGLAAPVVTVSPTNLTFASQSIGTTSAPQAVTMTNTGSGALTITSIVATGEFAQLNTCGTNLAAGATCTINVTFTPTATGSATGTLTITDNALSSPQMVSLGGSGSGFSVAVSPASASVVAGNSVSYTLIITPSFGFSARVNLSCSGAPRNATCSVSPSTVTPDGTDPITATATVTTEVRSLAPPQSGPRLNLPRLVTQFRPSWFLWMLLLLTLVASQVAARRRGVLLRLVLVAGLVLLWAACGAGGSQVGVADGTPAGNYTLTLTGSSGTPAVSHSTTATLSVQ
jgi:hypothetical protein